MPLARPRPAQSAGPAALGESLPGQRLYRQGLRFGAGSRQLLPDSRRRRQHHRLRPGNRQEVLTSLAGAPALSPWRDRRDREAAERASPSRAGHVRGDHPAAPGRGRAGPAGPVRAPRVGDELPRPAAHPRRPVGRRRPSRRPVGRPGIRRPARRRRTGGLCREPAEQAATPTRSDTSGCWATPGLSAAPSLTAGGWGCSWSRTRSSPAYSRDSRAAGGRARRPSKAAHREGRRATSSRDAEAASEERRMTRCPNLYGRMTSGLPCGKTV